MLYSGEPLVEIGGMAFYPALLQPLRPAVGAQEYFLCGRSAAERIFVSWHRPRGVGAFVPSLMRSNLWPIVRQLRR